MAYGSTTRRRELIKDFTDGINGTRRPIATRDEIAAGRRKARKFKSADDFYTSWCNFIDAIDETGYEITPTFIDFARWAGCATKEVYQTIEDYPELRKMIQESLADVLVKGGLKKIYEKTIAMFTLKNRCDWTDKREETRIQGEKQVADEATAAAKIREAVRRMNSLPEDEYDEAVGEVLRLG